MSELKHTIGEFGHPPHRVSNNDGKTAPRLLGGEVVPKS